MDIQKEIMYYSLRYIPVDRLFTRHSVIKSILSSFLFEKRNHFKMYLNVLGRWIFLVNIKTSSKPHGNNFHENFIKNQFLIESYFYISEQFVL
jgi:hypothetical protein